MATIALTSDFTIELWFKTSVSQIGTLLSAGDNWMTSGFLFALANNTGDYAYMQTPSGTAHWTGTVFDGVWHFLAMTFNNSTGHGTIYLDGVASTAVTMNPKTTSRIAIGGFLPPASAIQQVFNGDIDEVRISNNVRYTTNFDASTKKHLGSDANTLAYWRFQQGSGLTAADSSGNGKTLNLIDPGASLPAWTTGVTGGGSDKALSFDGMANYAQTASTLALTGGDFTVEAWIKSDQTNNPSVIVGMADDWSDSGWEFQANNDNDDYIAFTDAEGNVAYYICDNVGGQIFDGNWHHVAVDFSNDTQTATLFLDGQADVGDASELSALYTTSKISVGSSVRASMPTAYFNGTIDEVRISSTRRYAAFVDGASTFTPSQSFTTDANTLVLYKLNDGSGATAADSSSGNRPLSLPSVGGPPQWVAGVV